MNRDMVKKVENDQFAKLLGIEILEVDKGYSKVKMDLKQEHLNGVGIVQGGVIFTLADYAFAVASNAGGDVTVGINASIDYLRPPKGDVLFASAEEISSGKTLSHFSVKVFDGQERLVARFNGTGFIKRD